MPTIKQMLNSILTRGNLNQKELAIKLKVSPAQITRWLDNAEPRLKNFQKIQEIYNELTA